MSNQFVTDGGTPTTGPAQDTRKAVEDFAALSREEVAALSQEEVRDFLQEEGVDLTHHLKEMRARFAAIRAQERVGQVAETDAAVGQQGAEVGCRRGVIRKQWSEPAAEVNEDYEKARQIMGSRLYGLAVHNPIKAMAQALGIADTAVFSMNRSSGRAAPTSSGALPAPDAEPLAEKERWIQGEAEAILQSANALHAPVSFAPIEKYLGVASFELPLANAALEGCCVTNGKAGGIIINSGMTYVPRKNCTRAHEIGHFVLHRSTPGTFADDAETLHDFHVGFEREANVFASALLMPPSLLSSVYKPNVPPRLAILNAIEYKFRVSWLAALYRMVRVTELPCTLLVFRNGRLSWSLPSSAFQGESLTTGSLPPPRSTSQIYVKKRGDSRDKYFQPDTPAEWWLRSGDYSFAAENAFRLNEQYVYTLLTFRR